MDPDEACGGSYINLGVSRSFDVPFIDMPSFSTVDLGDQGDSGWTVTPTITYSSLLDTDVRHAHGGRDWNIIWGVSLGLSF